jgi:hypothetical protein
MLISWLQVHFPAQTVMVSPSFRVSNQDPIWSPHTPSCVEGQQHHYYAATCRWAKCAQCTPKSSTTGTGGFGLLCAVRDELRCCPNTFEEQPENVVLTRCIVIGLMTARLVDCE